MKDADLGVLWEGGVWHSGARLCRSSSCSRGFWPDGLSIQLAIRSASMATMWCYTYRYSWLPRLSSAMPSCAVADRGASSTGTPLAIGRSCTPPHESRKQRPQCPAMSERDLHIILPSRPVTGIRTASRTIASLNKAGRMSQI